MTASVIPNGSENDYVWLQRVTSWPLAAACAVGALATAAKGGQSPSGTALAVAAIAVGGVALSTVRVIIDSTGLTVGLGPWGRPAHHIPARSIRAARVEKTSALAFGGWGLRWRPGRTRIIIRSGPSLVVDLDNGTSFGITMKDAAAAAEFLNARLPV